MVCLIHILCYAMTSCFELYIKTCYHITFTVSQAFAWWNWGYGCYWFIFCEYLLFIETLLIRQTPLGIFQRKSVRQSVPQRKHSNILKTVVPFGEKGIECLSPQPTSLVIDSVHIWAVYVLVWRIVTQLIIMYCLVQLPAWCLIACDWCSANVCSVEVICLLNVFSIRLWVLWSRGLCVPCLCVPVFMPSAWHIMLIHRSVYTAQLWAESITKEVGWRQNTVFLTKWHYNCLQNVAIFSLSWAPSDWLTLENPKRSHAPTGHLSICQRFF